MRNHVLKSGPGDWVTAASQLPGRTRNQCCHRWRDVLDPRISKGPWTEEEDQKLREHVETYGSTDWVTAGAALVGRTGAQCRHRWIDVLDPTISKGPWTAEEDRKLTYYVGKHGPGDWVTIALNLPGRTRNQCRHRWVEVLNPNISKGPWTADEDDLLRAVVAREGSTDWVAVATHIAGRTGAQCRHRWKDVLDPAIDKSPWTAEEDEKLLAYISKHGTGDWVSIARTLPGRTRNQCRDRWIYSLDPSVVRAPWSPQDDEKLSDVISRLGTGDWSAIASHLSGRTIVQCRSRWTRQQAKKIHFLNQAEGNAKSSTGGRSSASGAAHAKSQTAKASSATAQSSSKPTAESNAASSKRPVTAESSEKVQPAASGNKKKHSSTVV